MSRGRALFDDRRVLSGITFNNNNGLTWCDAPKEYGPYKTSYNRWKRLINVGVFARIMEGACGQSPWQQDDLNRRDLPQSTPHDFQPKGKKGGVDVRLAVSKVG